MAGYDRALYQTFLKSIPMFSTCSTEQLDILAQLGDAITVTNGHAVVREGENSSEFYVVTSGRLRVDRGGRAAATLGAGDYFGELALFDSAPRNATVSAEGGQASLVALTRKAFQDALDDIPALRDALLHGMARRIHELDRQVLIAASAESIPGEV